MQWCGDKTMATTVHDNDVDVEIRCVEISNSPDFVRCVRLYSVRVSNEGTLN